MTIYETLTGSGPVIIEQIAGDMQLRGRPGQEAVINGELAEIELPDNEQSPIRIRCADDCSLKLPEHLPLRIQNVHGDTKITGVSARIDIDVINGDLSLRRIDNEVALNTINGDAEIKGINGNVTLTLVNGDASISRIGGQVTIGSVGGDLLLRDVSGGCNVESVSGSLRISINLSPEHNYNFSADNDVVMDVFPDTDATFYIPLDTDVLVRLAQDNITNATNEETGERMIRVGTGAATVRIDTAGSVVLRPAAEHSADFTVDIDFGEHIAEMESEINERFSDLGKMLEEKAKAFASASIKAVESMDIDVSMERVRNRAQRAQQRAQMRAERAQERAQRATERSHRYAERARRFEQRTQAANKQAEPVSNEERLLILKMVEDGKISIEEAERLLNTLENS